jgi:rod shape-determining protein MreC
VAISRRSSRSRITLALLILTSLVILTLDFRDAAVVEGARDVAGNVLAPVQRTAERALEPFENAWHGITDYGDVRAENEALRAQIDELEGQVDLDEAASEQLAALLEQADLEWVGDIETAQARVIAGPASNFAHTVDIDKGTNHGVRQGMPVVTGAGLLGIVAQASANRATVQTVSDPDLQIGVRLARLHTLGTARGQGQGEPLLVDIGIPEDEEVPRFLLVSTSGADRSKFPPDIPVGRIHDTTPARSGLTQDLIVEPAVDTNELSIVSVMLWEPPE